MGSEMCIRDRPRAIHKKRSASSAARDSISTIMTTILDAPGSNASDPFSTLIQALLTSNNFASTPAPTTELSVTVVDLITKVNTSRDPAHALWELWDAFFKAVVNLASSHAPYLALLDALRAQPPTQPSNVRAGSDAERQLRSYSQADGKLHWSALPRFGAQWRDVHDILEAWRCLLYTSPSPRDGLLSRMPSSA